MNSSRLPLSLVVLLATTTTSVCAQSALDPYEHIKAPASKKAAVPATDDSVTASPTYVTMPIGESAEASDKKSKFGFIPKVKMPNMGGLGDKFKSAGSAVAEKTKGVGSGIANGAKASGGLMAKPFSKGEKTKIATKEDWTKGSKSAGRAASLEGLYVQDAQKQIAVHKDKVKRETPKLEKGEEGKDKDKDKDKDKSLTQTALAPVKGAGAATKKLLAPLAKLKPKAGAPEERPASGFLEGALAKQNGQGLGGGKEAEKPAVAAAKPEPTGTPAELAAGPAPKKSKYGMGMLTKMKAPSIPFMGKKDGKTKVAKRAQVLDPQAPDATAPGTSALDPTAQAAKPAAPSTTPVNTPIAPELTQVAADKGAAKPAGKSKMAGMKSAMSGSLSAMGGGLSKMNPFKKKGIAAPPTAGTPEASKPPL